MKLVPIEIVNITSFTDRIRIDNSKKKFGWWEIVDDKVVIHLTNRKTKKTKTIKYMRDSFSMERRD